jgi:lysine 6-dehydrogenase
VTVRPTDVLQAVIDRNIKKNAKRIPRQEVHEIHFAIGQGTREGKPCQVTCRVIGHPDPLYDDYVDAGTSMNMSIGVQQMLSKPLKPGVWAAEEYFEAEAFFAELRKRHFAIEMETQVVETF